MLELSGEKIVHCLSTGPDTNPTMHLDAESGILHDFVTKEDIKVDMYHKLKPETIGKRKK